MNYPRPICLACQQALPLSDKTFLSPCNCGPFHSHCITNLEMLARRSGELYQLRCPVCQRVVEKVTQLQRFSPPRSRQPFTRSTIVHSTPTHLSQPPSPRSITEIPSPPPLGTSPLPCSPFLYNDVVGASAPPPTPPGAKRPLAVPLPPPRAGKIRVYSDIPFPAKSGAWTQGAVTPPVAAEYHVQVSGSMVFTVTPVAKKSEKHRARRRCHGHHRPNVCRWLSLKRAVKSLNEWLGPGTTAGNRCR